MKLKPEYKIDLFVILVFKDQKRKLLDFANEILTEKDRIRGGIDIVTEIPRNPTGKVLRHIMMKEAAARQI